MIREIGTNAKMEMMSTEMSKATYIYYVCYVNMYVMLYDGIA